MKNTASSYDYNTSWEKIRRIFPAADNLKILDLGCGDGRCIKHLHSKHHLFGIDSDAQAVAMANMNGITSVIGNIERKLPYADNFFDVVLAMDILEHLTSPAKCLKEIYRILKNNGQLIISIPNHFDLRTRLEILFGRGIVKWSQRAFASTAWDYAHVRFLTLSELRLLLIQEKWYPHIWQFNFMSGGIPPRWLIPRFFRRAMIHAWPNLWSGKFVVSCHKTYSGKSTTILIDSTPSIF